MVTKAAVRTVV